MNLKPSFYAVVCLSFSLLSCSQGFDVESRLQSGSIVGNGGDAYVCPGRNVEMLDTYEARRFRNGVTPALGAPTLSVDAKVELAISHIEKLDLKRAQTYRFYAKNFLSETRFLSGVVLTDLNDTGNVYPETECKIQQVVVQGSGMLPTDPFYTIDKDLWDKMDNDNRAILILHEIIYRNRIAAGDVDSRPTRLINSYLFSDTFEKMNSTQYENFWRQVDNGARTAKEALFYTFGDLKLNSQPKFGWMREVICEESIYGIPLNGKTFARPSCKDKKTLEPFVLSFGETTWLYESKDRFYPKNKTLVLSNGLEVPCESVEPKYQHISTSDPSIQDKFDCRNSSGGRTKLFGFDLELPPGYSHMWTLGDSRPGGQPYIQNGILSRNVRLPFKNNDVVFWRFVCEKSPTNCLANSTYQYSLKLPNSMVVMASKFYFDQTKLLVTGAEFEPTLVETPTQKLVLTSAVFTETGKLVEASLFESQIVNTKLFGAFKQSGESRKFFEDGYPANLNSRGQVVLKNESLEYLCSREDPRDIATVNFKADGKVDLQTSDCKRIR